MTDAELDAALRALTAVDPDPRLTDRVLRAIEQDAPAPRVVSWPRVAWAAAALVLCVSVALTWRLARPAAMPTPGAGPITVVADALPIPVMPAAVDVPGAVRTAPGAPDAPVAPGAPGSWPYSMPALDRVAPLGIDRLAHDPIPRQRLTIAPLSIDQLEVEALDR